MVSGSNCCAPSTVHLFLRTADGTFAARRDVRFVRTDIDPATRPVIKVFAKGHSRPHLLDFDRDGRTDLVHGGPPSWKLLVGAGPLAGKSEVELKSFPLPEIPGSHPQHFEFADWDGDGLFDLLMTVAHLKTPDKGPWLYDVYWLRNTSARGEPRFDPPARLFSIPEPWELNGIAVVPRDGGGRQDIVVSLARYWQRKPAGGWTYDSQLWLYRRKGVTP
jgi:hypothetical protein